MNTRVIFFGSSLHSLPTLEMLTRQDYLEVVAVVTQPDRPVARKQLLTPTPVSIFARKNNLPLLKPDSASQTPWHYARPSEVAAKIKQFKPDLFIVCYYGQKIPENIIKIAPLGGINIHPSLLPKYRGAAPAEWAILKGEHETGITILKLGKSFDSGEIIAQKKESLLPADTPEVVYERLFTHGANLLAEVLPKYLGGEVKTAPQNESLATNAPRLTREDGKIDWQEKPEKIERKIRAFSPWPGTWTNIKLGEDLKRLKILKAHLEKGKLILDEVQLEGKTPISYKQFQLAYPHYPLI